MATLKGEEIQAVGDRVLIKRDPAQDVSDLIQLPDDDMLRPGTATVVSAGCRAYGPEGLLKPGDRVFYHGNAIVTDLEDLQKQYGITKDYVFIRARDIYAVIEEAA